MTSEGASHLDELTVPPDFEMGVSTSAWQIEGDSAGRGRCTWDDFADIPGKIVDGATADPACDHVHRLQEDLDLLAWMGVDAYSFTFSWPRVIPGGVGKASFSGLDFYDRLVDGLPYKPKHKPNDSCGSDQPRQILLLLILALFLPPRE